MPGLGNAFSSSSQTLSRCRNQKPPLDPPDSRGSFPSEAAGNGGEKRCCEINQGMVLKNGDMDNGKEGLEDGGNGSPGVKSLGDQSKELKDENVTSGLPQQSGVFSLLADSPRLVDCRVCQDVIYPGAELLCSVRGCKVVVHSSCAKYSSKKFKCPQHACFLCKQKPDWRCVRCTLASHNKCAAFPEAVIHLENQPGRAVCWRHDPDWRKDKKIERPISDIKELFHLLPLPYVEEEFKLDFTWKDMAEKKIDPPSYVPIKRNVYLFKKKRSDIGADVGCSNCTTHCSEDCFCRVQSITCSKACHCSEMCTNRPFRKEKKLIIVETKRCGWGVEAAESIKKGEFIIEYVGEVIDDATCIKRLWDMKDKGFENFYMCEIQKNFTIDATFKGNASRFLNHSCFPNCKMDKWHVDGETRVGVFATRSIKAGEPLTYDYRFVQFGAEVKCECGAPNCRGYLGTKKKDQKVVDFRRIINFSWGTKRRRSAVVTQCWKTNHQTVITNTNTIQER